MDKFYAYALGYYQGMEIGYFENDNYHTWGDDCQLLYKQGYDRGLSDYCLTIEN